MYEKRIRGEKKREKGDKWEASAMVWVSSNGACSWVVGSTGGGERRLIRKLASYVLPILFPVSPVGIHSIF